MNRVAILSCLLCLVVVLSGCGRGTTPAPMSTPTPAATNTLVPTPTSTATSTSTHTPTPLPTSTPTITFTPTLTPFPSLTPLPPGYYANFNAGFSFKHPVSWKLDEETETFVRMIDQSMGMVVIVLGYPAVDKSTGMNPENIDSVAKEINKGVFEGKGTLAKETFLVKIGGDEEAPAKEIMYKQQNTELLARIVFHTRNFRSYVFIFIGAPQTIKAGQVMIERLLSSVSFFSPQPFGLPKDHNLVLAGYDPEPVDLDPAKMTGNASGYVGLLFTGLVRLTPDMQIVPDLAETFSVSPDGTVYTFTLRTGLKFANGSDLTTEDVIFSWERAADPAVESPTARTYLGDILGFEEKLDGKADSIAGLKAIDDRSLEITLDAPKPYFLAKLTYPTAFIVDSDTVTGADDWVWKANASGPYVIKEYKEKVMMVFERNPYYTPATAIQYVTYIINPGGSWISRYEDGTLDIVSVVDETAARVRREDDPLHKELQSVTSLCTTYVSFNNTIPPFDDSLVRKAFTLAIDRDTYVERLTNGISVPALTILPPGMPGFSENLSITAFNAQAARQALKESSYAGKLPEITLEAAGFATQGSDAVNALVDMWQKALGVKVKVSFLDPRNYPVASLKESGNMHLGGWCADYPDPQNFLDILFRAGSELNAAGYSNKDVDALLDKAAVEIDPAKRLDLYQEIEKLLLDDYAVIPIEHGVANVLVKPRLQGYVLSSIVTLYLPWLSLLPTIE